MVSPKKITTDAPAPAVSRFRQSQAALHRVPPTRSYLFFVRDTRKAKDVLGLLGLHDVDHVVERDASQETPRFVTDRNTDEVVAGEYLTHLLLVDLREERHGERLRDLRDRGGGIGQDQLVQGHRAEEDTSAIHDEDGVEILDFPPPKTDLADGFGGGEVTSHRDELRGHPPAGGLLVIAEQPPQLPRLSKG
jgi:hypothetical protein